jgi:hypothetical protein
MKVTNIFTTNMEIIFARSYVFMKTTCSYFGLKIHVMNYVKSLFINNIDKKDQDKVDVILGFKITISEKRIF